MHLTVRRSVRPLAAAVAALTLVACGSGGADEAPTQTPIYVVITDTPEASAADLAPTAEPDAENGGTDAATDAETAEAVTPSPADSEASDDGIVAIPTPFLCKAEVVEQTYENGFMFWVGGTASERCKTEHDFEPGSGEIWIAIFDEGFEQVGQWVVVTDNWDEATEPETDPDFEPPNEDLLQPARGFGKAWREGLTDDQREELGWATAGEFKFVTDYRYDAGGFLNDAGEYVPRPGIHRIVALGGEQLFYDEQSRTVFYIAAEE